MKDHRYPEEVRKDFCRRITLVHHPELARLVDDHGPDAVLCAALEIQRARWGMDDVAQS